MTDAKLACLEDKAILVDSEFYGIHYAIDKSGRGMWILVDGREIPILAENIKQFANEGGIV